MAAERAADVVSVAGGPDLAEDAEQKERVAHQVPPRLVSRLLPEPPHPFMAQVTQPSRSPTDVPRPEVEQPTDRHADGHVEFMPVFEYPAFLNGVTHADQEHVGACLVDLPDYACGDIRIVQVSVVEPDLGPSGEIRLGMFRRAADRVLVGAQEEVSISAAGGCPKELRS